MNNKSRSIHWRRSPKDIVEVEKQAKAKGLDMHWIGSILYVFNHGHWLEFMRDAGITLYRPRRRKLPTRRHIRVSSGTEGTFYCETCRYFYPDEEMETLNIDRKEYCVCKGCVDRTVAYAQAEGVRVRILGGP